VGTGGLFLGNSILPHQSFRFPALKGDFLKMKVWTFVTDVPDDEKWELIVYYFGGYGKVNQDLSNFSISF
jgi:1-aminocyclopropane-1-carboxylate deaminase